MNMPETFPSFAENEPQVLSDLEQLSVDYYDDPSPANKEQLIEAVMRNSEAEGSFGDKGSIEGTNEALNSSLAIVATLKMQADGHKRTYNPNIQAVHVFSGPGTYLQPLDDTQYNESYCRWADRNRGQLGAALARQVAAERIKVVLSGRQTTDEDFSREQLAENAPNIFYNGQPFENEALMEALDEEGKLLQRIPRDKFIISGGYIDGNGEKQPIGNTSHQTRDLFQQIENGNLHGVRNLAVVAHVPDMIRIPFYLRKDYDEYLSRGNDPVNFWVYALRGRRGSSEASGRQDTIPKHMAGELMRLVKYLQSGYLSHEPVLFQNLDLQGEDLQ